MRRYSYFCCLAQLLVLIAVQPAWGSVLPGGARVSFAETPLALHPELKETLVCCDQTVKRHDNVDKIMVAQLLDILSGAVKLISNAVDKLKDEKTDSQISLELLKQEEEKNRLKEERQRLAAEKKIYSSIEHEDQKRQTLSDPFSPPIEKHIAEKAPIESAQNPASAVPAAGENSGGSTLLPPPVTSLALPASIGVTASILPAEVSQQASAPPRDLPPAKIEDRTKTGIDSPPVQAGKTSPPFGSISAPAKKSDNPFDN